MSIKVVLTNDNYELSKQVLTSKVIEVTARTLLAVYIPVGLDHKVIDYNIFNECETTIERTHDSSKSKSMYCGKM